jgi:hypothetical protein
MNAARTQSYWPQLLATVRPNALTCRFLALPTQPRSCSAHTCSEFTIGLGDVT